MRELNIAYSSIWEGALKLYQTLDEVNSNGT